MVAAIKQHIQAGTYVTPAKVRIAAERLAAVMGVPCRVKPAKERQ